MSMVKCCQLPKLPTSMCSDSADCLRNDFQTAIRRNFQTWVKWRTKLNDNLVDAVMTGSELDGVESFREYLEGDAPDPDHPTSNPRTLLTFSASSNTATNLHSKEFVKYGIPRAKLDPRTDATRRSHLSDDFDVDAQSTAQCDVEQDDSNSDCEDLKLDYFYQSESEAAELMSTVVGLPRRFHRSAATLPVTPVVDDTTDRRNRFFRRKAKQRQQMPPSYVEPFLRTGHGFITARRDKELYTRSAGYLDELWRQSSQ